MSAVRLFIDYGKIMGVLQMPDSLFVHGASFSKN